MSEKNRERAVYAEMVIAAILTSAALANNRSDQQVIDRYKLMLQALRVAGLQ